MQQFKIAAEHQTTLKRPLLEWKENNNTNDGLNEMTPYKRMEDEDEEFDPYDDKLSDLYRKSMAEAAEHECDTKRVIFSFLILITIGVVIFLAFYFKSFFMGKIDTFTGTMAEYPISSIMIFLAAMIILIGASVPSAIPIVFGSFVFVRAFGFYNGLWIFILVDYVAMQIGSIPPFIYSRYLLRM